MKVDLISYTPDALELLLFTKQTRLTQEAGLMEQIRAWPLERKMSELAYMRGTIQSSWEFIGYTFAITGVSRAFTHQFVRSRTGSYAQQSQRTVDMTQFDYVMPTAFERDREDGGVLADLYEDIMSEQAGDYHRLRENGALPQDARAVLPTNVATNIIAAFNLRSLSDMAKTRLCTRTQGEYQLVFREMRQRVIEVHPWAEDFINVACVATGVCQFPNFLECKIKPPVFNPDTGMRWDLEPKLPATRAEIKANWEDVFQEAIPSEGKKT